MPANEARIIRAGRGSPDRSGRWYALPPVRLPDNNVAILSQPESRPRLFALIPASGTGSRIGESTPKQYLPVAGQPLLFYPVLAMAENHRIASIFVVLSPSDAHFDQFDWGRFGTRLTALRIGGDTRAETVLNGLRAIESQVHGHDWILVHDAARPCLTRKLLDRLIDSVVNDDVGGLLALPVADTIKSAAETRRVSATVDRSALWQAQTPQMFRYRLLRMALERANLGTVTDEASAMEQSGHEPYLVESDVTNLKVTYPSDLQLAELILRSYAHEAPKVPSEPGA